MLAVTSADGELGKRAAGLSRQIHEGQSSREERKKLKDAAVSLQFDRNGIA